jgi:opacity protein-like surface antigen
MTRHLPSSLLLAAFLIGGVSVPAFAQDAPRGTVAGGYTYLREQGPGGFDPETYPSGWAAAVTFRVAGRLSAVGEIGVSSRTNVGDEHIHLLGAFGGARFDILRAGRTQVFVQGLVGTERFSEPGFSESGLAFQLGAGADIPVWTSWFARVQADYRRANQTAGSFNELRLFVGGGFAF